MRGGLPHAIRSAAVSALLLVSLTPAAALAEPAGGEGAVGGGGTLVAAAVAAWLLLVLLVGLQFLRQRRLARRLDEVEAALEAQRREGNGEG